MAPVQPPWGFTSSWLFFFWQICDPDTGERLGPNKTGEIRVKSEHNMMLGYLKRPKETADYFDKEGFGQTGDLGYYDENGKLFFVDRLKELIK